jgi:hypothetical protein
MDVYHRNFLHGSISLYGFFLVFVFFEDMHGNGFEIKGMRADPVKAHLLETK